MRPSVGVVPLRPLSVGEILDGAFQAVRGNARTMVGTAAVVVAAVTVLSIVPQALILNGFAGSLRLAGQPDTSLTDDLAMVTGLVAAGVVPGILTWIAVTMLNAMLIVPVSEAVLGRRISTGEMWQRSKARLLAALGLSLLVGVLGALAVAALVAPGVIALVTGSTDLGAILLFAGAVAALVLVVFVAVRWSLAAPALVLEQQPVDGALRRSWRLVGGSWWRVLGILLLSAIITSIGQAVITVPTGLLAGLPAAGQASPYDSLGATFAQLVISGVGTIAAGAIFYPFSAAVTALLYIDLRMRREGLDVRLAQAAADPGRQS